MPKKAREMTTIEVKRIIKPGGQAVGSVPGLLLVMKDIGSKSLILRVFILN